MGPTSEVTICAYSECSENADLFCSDCKDAPQVHHNDIDLLSVRYCSTKCQRADWSNHKKLCKQLKTIKMFYRAGDLLQDIFYHSRKEQFDRNYWKIEKKDGKLYVYEKAVGGIEALPVASRPFPDHLFITENGLSEDDKKSVLTHVGCSCAVGGFHDIIKHYIEHLAVNPSSIKELRVTLRDRPLTIVRIDDHNRERIWASERPHDVIKIQLKNNGGTYILDLTGAQFGFFEPVIPAKIYAKRLRTMESGVGALGAFGGMKEYYERVPKMENMPAEVRSVVGINKQMFRILLQQISKWEKNPERSVLAGKVLTAESILVLSVKDFEMAKKDLLASLNSTILASIFEDLTRLTNKDVEEEAPGADLLNERFQKIKSWMNGTVEPSLKDVDRLLSETVLGISKVPKRSDGSSKDGESL